MSIENSKNLCIGCFGQLNPGSQYCPLCGYDQNKTPETSYHLTPRTILSGKFMVGKVLGEGGFGITYIGHDVNLEIKVAIKEYYPSGFVSRTTTLSTTVQPASGSQGEFFTKGRDRFVDEARRLAKFSNLPGIVMVKDFFIENGTAYIVMEFVEGQTLKEYLMQVGGRLSVDQVLEMLKPVFESLSKVHEKGIIHRDISPDNLMISRDGSLKLLDFGAAREFGDDGNKSMSVMLKHGYAPAEQYSTKGVQGAFTDVYALSATIYKAITGVTPESSMDRLMDDTLQPPSYLGVYIQPYQEAALMRGLAIRQEQRFQTVTELSMALLGQIPVTAPAYHQPHPQPQYAPPVQQTPPQYVPPTVQSPHPEPQPVMTQPAQPDEQTQMPQKEAKQNRVQSEPQNKKPKKKNTAAIVISIVAACLVIAFGALFFFTDIIGGSGPESTPPQGDISGPGGSDNPVIIGESPFNSYKDIPGITDTEIAAIERLQQTHSFFVCADVFSTEAFYDTDGEQRGWSVLFYEWMTELFGIQFIPFVEEWTYILQAMENQHVSFTISMRPTEERMLNYFMTSTIAERLLRFYVLPNSTPLDEIEKTRLLRLAFIEGTTLIDEFASASENINYETHIVSGYEEAVYLLNRGDIDAIAGWSNAEAQIDEISNVPVRAIDYKTNLSIPISFATQNPELEPIISIINKAIHGGAADYLKSLYDKGYADYLDYKYTYLTDWGPSLPPDDDYPAEPDETGFLRFSYTDLEVSYEWEYGWRGNDYAIGGCIISFRVLGDYSDVAMMIIPYAMPMHWESYSIQEIAAQMSEVWHAQRDDLNLDARDFNGWVEQGFPISRLNLGESGDVLFLAIDRHVNVIGYVLIPVDAPSLEDLPRFNNPYFDAPEADSPAEPRG